MLGNHGQTAQAILRPELHKPLRQNFIKFQNQRQEEEMSEKQQQEPPNRSMAIDEILIKSEKKRQGANSDNPQIRPLPGE